MGNLNCNSKINRIIKWFLEEHRELVSGNRINSWAETLGIQLNEQGVLSEKGLFELFVLATLWNNPPTYNTEKGAQVFESIKNQYTLTNFKQAETNTTLKNELKKIATSTIGNQGIFDLLNYLTNETIWNKIKQILNSPKIGEQEADIERLSNLYGLFNPRRYSGGAFLTVKVFLIFRELRIQFRNIEKYQYHPAICCIPDSHVRNALKELGLISDDRIDVKSLISYSQIVAEHFCTGTYELYDLPLFFVHKENCLNKIIAAGSCASTSEKDAGYCPSCGSPLIWRQARLTGEFYKGCTNFRGGCRWHNRSY
ncbi:MAG: hypothetical protein QXZ70_03535 [Candidatus Bathyarchaeia archaeon]